MNVLLKNQKKNMRSLKRSKYKIRGFHFGLMVSRGLSLKEDPRAPRAPGQSPVGSGGRGIRVRGDEGGMRVKKGYESGGRLDPGEGS